MTNLKKLGLTTLAGSLVATAASAGALDVSGAAKVTYASGNNGGVNGNPFSMTRDISFTGSGEMDNGWGVTVSMQLDNNASSASGTFMDNRSIAINLGESGTLTFYGHGGSDAYGLIDDVMPHADGNETWDIVAAAEGGTAKFGSIGGTTSNNSFMYAVSPSMVDGLSLNVSYVPSAAAGTTTAESTTAFSVKYTGYEGLTVGYAAGEANAEGGTNNTDNTTMYVKYAYGPVTVGIQESEIDSTAATNDDEFESMGITYQVSDDLTIGYTESSYNDGNLATDQEI